MRHTVFTLTCALGLLAGPWQALAQTAPVQVPAAAPQVTTVATSIQLPDGTVCKSAGMGATLAFEGQRVNYSCGTAADGSTTVLLGEVSTNAVAALTVTRGVVERTANGFGLRTSDTLTMDLASIEVADGTTCLNTGRGATLVFEDERLNFSCEANTGLIGAPDTSSGPIWTIKRVTFEQGTDGFAEVASLAVGVSAVIGTDGGG